MRLQLIILSFIFSTFAFSQERLLISRVDSIGIDYRSGGASLDSVDAVNVGNINLRPAAGFAEIYEFNLAQNLYTSPGGFTYFQNEKRARIVRSPLPYLGFQYAFGEGMNQALNVEYHHFIKEQSHFHIRYHRRTSEGLMRRGAFILNDLNILVHHKEDRWRTAFDGYYGGYDYEENGGIPTEASVGENNQTLEFVPINIENAESEVRKVDLNWKNYYDIYQDSLIKHGLKSRSRYELTGRVYRETGLDSGIVENIFIDSNETRDQFQTASITNGFGYFFSSNFLQIDGTLNHKFWRNQNLGRYRDTTELFLHSNLRIGWDNLYINNEFYFNTLGALGEFYNKSKLTFKPFPKTVVKGALNFDNRLPIPFQRFYFSNHLQWELDELQTQQIINIHGRIDYGDKIKAYAQLDFTTVNNGLYFIDNEWRQDVFQVVSVGALTVGGEYNLGNFNFYPKVTARFNDTEFSYQPAFSARARIAYKKGYFEGESLILAYGVDLGYDSEYDHMMYNPYINVMEPGKPGMETPELFRINFFFAAQVDQFRFFLRAENIDYFINDNSYRIDPLYPITPFIIRAGITWDFFN